MSYQNVIVAVEANAEASAIVEKAKLLAGDTPLSIVTVVPDIVHHYGAAWTTEAGDMMAKILEGARDQAEEKLQSLAQSEGIASDRVYVREGQPATVVQDLATELDADCIVVGTHGQHGIALFFGSTANSLIHGLDCDAYLVRVGE